MGLALWGLEEKADDDDGDGAKGEIDVEAPSPANMVGEGSTKQRSSNGGDSVHGANDTGVDRSFDERDRERDDDQSTGKDAGATNAGNCAADDQRL